MRYDPANFRSFNVRICVIVFCFMKFGVEFLVSRRQFLFIFMLGIILPEINVTVCCLKCGIAFLVTTASDLGVMECGLGVWVGGSKVGPHSMSKSRKYETELQAATRS